MSNLHKDIKKVLVDEAAIIEKCKELGKQISDEYRNSDKPPLFVAILKGSIPFLSELIKHVDLDIEYYFMNVSSYDGTESIGDVRIIKDLDRSIKNEPILLVEDIVDTGRTINEVTKLLINKGASEVKIVALLDKPSRRVIEINADYVDIANARIKHYKENEYVQIDLFEIGE